MRKKIFLIDGSGFIFRAFYAIPSLKRKDGLSVNALFGFVNMLLKMQSMFGADKVCVLFDSKQKTFRHNLYDEYKANRKEMPEELALQIPMIHEFCRIIGFTNLIKEGVEADDLIASLCKTYRNEEIVIVTSDKDMMQLLYHPNVNIYDPNKNKELTEKDLMEKFGVTPDKMLFVQALAGDSSDNIPGAPGIGVKTAALLINEFGTLENLLANGESIKQNKRRESILNNKDLIRTSYKLVQLKDDILTPPITGYFNPNKHDLMKFLLENDFQSLITRHKNILPEFIPCIETRERKILMANSLEHIYKEAQVAGLLSFYSNTEHIKLGVIDTNQSLLSYNLTDRDNPILQKILQDDSIQKIVIDLREELIAGLKEINCIDSLKTMTYVLYNGINSDINSFINPEITKPEYLCGMMLDKYNLFISELFNKHLLYLYKNIELPIVMIAYKMGKNGFLLNSEYLEDLGTKLKIKIKEQEESIFNIAGKVFNIASPNQLSQILFTKLGIPKPPKKSKTKTGQDSTDVTVLTKLKDAGFEIADHILQWRHLSKIKNTYTDSLLNKICSDTHRVHSQFLTNHTLTGRFSSREPNLQNIPVQGEDTYSIRKAFIAPEGKTLISFDYSQIELRILAHLAYIRPLIDAFKKNLDIHTITAQQLFFTDNISTKQRKMAKMINFSIIYGISPFGLAEHLKIPTTDAKNYIEAYLNQYPGIRDYMEESKEKAKMIGYVTTILGRRCYIKDINSANHNLKSFAQRQAINAPIQGSSSDMIKKAMVLLDKQLPLNVKILLQIHDELILEAPNNESEDTLQKQINSWSEIMERAIELKVPVKVQTKISQSWE